ncbi:MAG: hypothetical protein J4F35_12580 [Candidatus Latescibacteria bacterium]|nr:hypothetical protein [Candidatus Latescibacterota bacterium]
MKKRMLMAGVALAFASAAWAQCPYGAMELMGPEDVRVSLASPQSQFVLVEWEEVEDATRYAIYLQVFDPDEIEVEAGGEIVEPAETQPTFVPWGHVEATPAQGRYSTEFFPDLPNPESVVYGVSWVSSPIVPASWTAPQISTATEAVTWGQVKATAAD